MRSITLLVLLLLIATELRGQELAGARGEYKVEVHASGGPMYSVYRERIVPPGKSKNTFGFQGIIRAMWHPDHMLAIGLITGHQLFASESFVLKDEFGEWPVQAWLSATPVLIDVSMQDGGLEWGIGLGAYIMHSVLEDEVRSESSRLELGVMGHASYTYPVTKQLRIGPEVAVNYLSYRGILSFVPRVDLKYDLFTY